MAKHLTYSENTHRYHRERIDAYKSVNLFGKKLQYQMDKYHLSVSDLAFITGISGQTIRTWLNGEHAPNFYDVLYLCDTIPEFDYEFFFSQL